MPETVHLEVYMLYAKLKRQTGKIYFINLVLFTLEAKLFYLMLCGLLYPNLFFFRTYVKVSEFYFRFNSVNKLFYVIFIDFRTNLDRPSKFNGMILRLALLEKNAKAIAFFSSQSSP